jgi:type IV pilus modification protein PilV
MITSESASVSPRRAQQRGVGLIEVLIALVILAIGFLALAALQGAITRNAADSRARTAATSMAKEKLEELRSFVSGRADANGDGVPDLIIDLDVMASAMPSV